MSDKEKGCNAKLPETGKHWLIVLSEEVLCNSTLNGCKGSYSEKKKIAGGQL